MQQEAFQEIKRIVSRYVFLVYTFFNKCSDIHAYKNTFQVCIAISQEVKRITLCSQNILGIM